MILKEYNLSVRLPQERAIDTGITLVQNDKDVYKLNVRIFDGVNEIDYTDVDEATITFLKSDKNVVQGDMTVEADQLSYTLGTNEIACPGKVLVSIQLFGSTERLSTARFVIYVERDLVTEDAVKSASEFPILQQLKQDLEAIDVVELTNEFNAHKAESMLLKEVHGLRIESGAWTPSLMFGSASTGITYSLQTGSYLRIGDLVFATLEFTLSSKGTSVGAAVINGLPYAATVGQSISLSEIVSTNLPEGGVSFFAGVVGTQLYLRSVVAGAGYKAFDDTLFTNYSRFRTNFMYKI